MAFDGAGLETRSMVWERSSEMREFDDDVQAEQALDELLTDVGQAIRDDLPTEGDAFEPDAISLYAEDDGWALLGAVESWASVLSSAVEWVYAPHSPSQRRLAGWARNIAEKLRECVRLLRPHLKKAAALLGALGFSVAVGFPWGVSVGLAFT